jgi:hypothetical protein
MTNGMIAMIVEPTDVPQRRQGSALGICCAATWEQGEERGRDWYTRNHGGKVAARMSRTDAQSLVSYLQARTTEGATLVSYDGAHCDLRLLGSVGQRKRICRGLALEHIDIVVDSIMRIGYKVQLDRLAAGMKIDRKLPRLSPAERQQLWSDGRENVVLRQTLEQARIILGVALTGQTNGRIRWISRSGVPKPRSLGQGWWTVFQALAAPPPQNSWMSNPPQVEERTDWLR